MDNMYAENYVLSDSSVPLGPELIKREVMFYEETVPLHIAMVTFDCGLNDILKNPNNYFETRIEDCIEVSIPFKVNTIEKQENTCESSDKRKDNMGVDVNSIKQSVSVSQQSHYNTSNFCDVLKVYSKTVNAKSATKVQNSPPNPMFFGPIQTDEFECTALSCNKTFPTESQLDKHINKCQYIDYTCKQCYAKCKSRDSLDKHVHHKHKNHDIEEIGIFLCQTCHLSFSFEEQLETHMKSLLHKVKIQPIIQNQCVVNNKPQIFMNMLNPHMSINYSGENMELSPKTVLSSHEINIHRYEKSVTCTICGLSCNSEHALTIHMRHIHRGKIFKCSLCSKMFYFKKYLERHMESHNKPLLKCDHCDRHFKCARYLLPHMRQHTGETPYKCPMCDASFKHNVSKKKHFLKTHLPKDLEVTKLPRSFRVDI